MELAAGVVVGLASALAITPGNFSHNPPIGSDVRVAGPACIDRYPHSSLTYVTIKQA